MKNKQLKPFNLKEKRMRVALKMVKLGYNPLTKEEQTLKIKNLKNN